MARSFISWECWKSSWTPQPPTQTPTQSPSSQTPSSETCHEPRNSPFALLPPLQAGKHPSSLELWRGSIPRPHNFLPPSRSFLTLLSSQGSRLSKRQSGTRKGPSLRGSPKWVTQPSGLWRMFPALFTLHHALPCLTPHTVLLPLPETLPLRPSLPSPPLFLLTFQPHHKCPFFRKDFLDAPRQESTSCFSFISFTELR